MRNWDWKHWVLATLAAGFLAGAVVIFVEDRGVAQHYNQQIDLLALECAAADEGLYVEITAARILIARMMEDTGIDPLLRGEALAFLKGG